MNFPDASRFAAHHDVVLVGYRGVDGSSKLDCPEVISAREHARDFLTEQAFRADAAAFRACAQRRDGTDLAGYTLPERVDDLDAARQALGYQRIDLLSESAGTRTALIYAWRYPTRITRSVLIAVNPPGDYLWDARTTGEQIGRYAALCAQDSSCRSRTPDLAASLHSAYAHIPGRFWFLPVKKGTVQTTAFWGLMQATSAAAPISAPMTIDTLLAAGRGDGSGSWFLALMGQLIFPKAQVWGDVAAIGASRYTPNRVDFTPGTTQGEIAKIAVGVMAGLAALTVLMLVWLPLRLRRRGSFGRTASGAIRSASPLLFGLGGWLLGTLVVLTALPTIPITDELLVALSAGLPTGLGIYFAWTNRAWSARTRTIGLAAAAGGALVGAWLGFNATSGLAMLAWSGPLLAIAGAAIGANLTVLALDIAWDRQVRDRFTAGAGAVPATRASSRPG